MKKRLLSLLLCLVLVLMTTPFFVSAEPLFTEHLTAIEADSVFNTDGYASLKINEIDADEDFELESMPKSALADKDGNMVFPYKETFYRYRYRDGVVSLTNDSIYEEYYTDKPQYFSIDGAPLFENTAPFASPMTDGYAFLLKRDEQQHYTAVLVNQAGDITFEFPEKFNTTDSWGGGQYSEGIGMQATVGWPSEGLIAFFDTGYDRTTEPWEYHCELKGYYDMSGNVALSLLGYADGFPFYEGLAAVKSAETGKFGFIDKTGKIVIACRFDKADGFQNGYAGVGIDDKYGYIDKAGDVVIPLEYDDVYGAGDGFFSAVKNGKCGLVDVNNNVVIPFEYDDISSCDNGVCYAIKDRKLVIFTLNNSQAAIGDASGDGVVNMKDVLAVRKFVAGIAMNGFNEAAADVNKDGAVNMKDVLLVRKFIAGLVKELG